MSAHDLDGLTFTDEEIDEILRGIEMDAASIGASFSGTDWGWEYDDWDSESPTREPDRTCQHTWTPVLLINTTVYHCKHCGMKKEDYENSKTSR